MSDQRRTGGTLLKYQAELGHCKDQPCPNPHKFQPRDRANCYRFVHGEVANDGDFVPFAYTEHGQLHIGQRTCGHYGLSFFDSPAAVRRKWEKLHEREDAALRYGTHVAEIDLTHKDGLLDNPSQMTGHFELHEYLTCIPLAPRVKGKATPLQPQPKQIVKTTSVREVSPVIKSKNGRAYGH